MIQARFLGIPAPVWEKEFAPTHTEWDRKSYKMHEGKKCLLHFAKLRISEGNYWYAEFDDGFAPTDPLPEKFFSVEEWETPKEEEE